MQSQEVEKRIEEFFNLNYERLRLEGGHGITDDIRQFALQQVIMYWRKLRDVAENVTQTEVKLTLPDMVSPRLKKRYTIEGVVDIVKEEGETWMYDIKTHDLDYIQENRELYESQLNVYAYIWQGLRQQALDHTAIISTAIPDELRSALRRGDKNAIEKGIEDWNPLVELNFAQGKVEHTIKEFGKVVDKIENHEFRPPPLKKLKDRVAGARSNEQFGTRVCRNCDARYSCNSYREFAQGTYGKTKMLFKKYYNDYGNDADQEDFLTANIQLEKIPENIDIPRE
jgi:hypothetical protein